MTRRRSRPAPFRPPARFYGIGVSSALHALALLIFALPSNPRRPPPPLQEAVPVEIWTPEQVRELTAPPTPETGGPSLPQSQPDAEAAASPKPASDEPPPANPDPINSNTIRATTMLSGKTLAHPRSRKMREMLSRFEEGTRLEQLCGLEAMAQIAALLKPFRPDRVVTYARADVKIETNRVVAEGAAFRSRRQWYGLAFTCGLSPDRQAVQSFEFSVGEAIPKDAWDRYNLPDPALDTD